MRGDLLEVKKLANLVQEAIGAFGRLDVVINNASAFYPTSVGDTDEKQWQELMGTNLKAPYFLIQSAARELRQRHGCVVNMVDIYGQRPLAEHPVYCAAKAGLIMLTKALAVELAPEVRVNAVAPGAILWPEHNHDEVAQQRLVSQTPLRRIGTTAEVTAAVLFLLRDARFTTGHVIPVDGGRTILS